jgi:hypothetical protein
MVRQNSFSTTHCLQLKNSTDAAYDQNLARRRAIAKRARYVARKALRKATIALDAMSLDTKPSADPTATASTATTHPSTRAPALSGLETSYATTTPLHPSLPAKSPAQSLTKSAKVKRPREIPCCCGRTFRSEQGRLLHVEKGNHERLMAKVVVADGQRSTKRLRLKTANVQKEKQEVVQRAFEELTLKSAA